jgi:tetratricopeptide (TPR) repeat protein
VKLLAGLLYAASLLAQSTQHASSARTSSFDVISKKAEEARQANNAATAIDLYQQVLKLKPTWSEGWWYLGTLYYDSDQYPQGRDAFRRVTLQEPKLAVGWAMLGLCEFETKDYDRSLEHLRRASILGMDPEQGFYEVARYHEALLLTRSGDFDAAIAVLARLIGTNTQASPKLIEAMGLACLFKPVLPTEYNPSEREFVLSVGRAMAAAAARHGPDAAAALQTIVAEHPTAPQLHYLYGLVLLSSDSDKALEMLKQELTISPAHEQALISIAGEYLKRTEYQTALQYAEKAVEANSRDFATHAMLGRVLAEGDLDTLRGLKELETAAHLSPNSVQVHFALATAYAKAGRKEDAARERAEFLRLRSETDGEATQAH